EEAAHVWSLMQQGVIRDIWFTRDRRAVLILECTGEPELARELASLPLVRERLITFDVETLLRYDGFDRLSPKPPAPSR
ncbi:MAG TPA: hypothetical protein VHE61_09050, partial [Opitutaceae bacterium]|nr:hypothetical protein [Opitutaceae bacterium]